jgi:hypothetical protein
MVWTFITALVVMIIFFIYLGWMFFVPVIELIINGAIIYALFLRGHAEIVKEKKHGFYMGAAVAAMIVYVIGGNFLSGLHVWGITTFLILAFVLAQVGVLIKYLEDKYAKHNHAKKH